LELKSITGETNQSADFLSRLRHGVAEDLGINVIDTKCQPAHPTPGKIEPESLEILLFDGIPTAELRKNQQEFGNEVLRNPENIEVNL